jgi:hypothetical protein
VCLRERKRERERERQRETGRQTGRERRILKNYSYNDIVLLSILTMLLVRSPGFTLHEFVPFDQHPISLTPQTLEPTFLLPASMNLTYYW